MYEDKLIDFKKGERQRERETGRERGREKYAHVEKRLDKENQLLKC